MKNQALTKWAQLIEKSNQEFKAMSKPEKRVQIAKDCIVRLQQGQLSASGGQVIVLPYGIDKNKSLKEILDTNHNLTCTVCAKGGLFISYIGRVNKFKAHDVDNDSAHDSNEMRKLRRLFSDRQLVIIEYAFEGYQVISCTYNRDDIYLSSQLEDKLQDFHKRYSNGSARLEAICENIIENKGIFKL